MSNKKSPRSEDRARKVTFWSTDRGPGRYWLRTAVKALSVGRGVAACEENKKVRCNR